MTLRSWLVRTALAGVLLALGCGRPPLTDLAAFEREVVRAQELQLQSIEGLVVYGEADVVSDGQRVSGRLRVVYVAPDRFRLDTELPGVFGWLGGRLTVWAGAEGFFWKSSDDPRVQRGRADPVLSRILGREPTPGDLRTLLFGLPAWWGSDALATRGGRLRGQPPAGSLTLTRADGLVETGTVGGDGPVLQSLERADSSGTVVRVRWDGHERHRLGLLARRVTLRSPRVGDQATLRWRRFEDEPDKALSALEWPH